MPELTNHGVLSDFYFIHAEQPEDGIAKIIAVVRDRIPKAFGLDAIRDVQVLCPMNRGGLGARSLNVELQRALNPPGQEHALSALAGPSARATRSCRSKVTMIARSIIQW